MDFIKNLKISDDKEPEQNLATTAPPVATPSSTKDKLFGKLSDALGGDNKETKVPVQAPVPKKEEESIFDRIGDKLTGKKTPPPPPPPPEPETLFDKIGSAFGKKPTPPPPEPAKTDLFSKITDTISGKKEEPPKPQSLGDKLNHALGGGAKGEAEEGKLGKAIDLFQEHVLKEGPQHNESAVEQLKDKHIEATIRKTLGLGEKEKN